MEDSDRNPSFREAVFLSGTLANSTLRSRCIVRATKVTIPKLGITEYVKADVALAPPFMPDGEYELHFEGRRMRVMNAAGQWSSVADRRTHSLLRSLPHL